MVSAYSRGRGCEGNNIVRAFDATMLGMVGTLGSKVCSCQHLPKGLLVSFACLSLVIASLTP